MAKQVRPLNDGHAGQVRPRGQSAGWQRRVVVGRPRVEPTDRGAQSARRHRPLPTGVNGLSRSGQAGVEPAGPRGVGWRGSEWPAGLWAGLTWAGSGSGRACSQRCSSQTTQASREGPFRRQAWLPSSMSRSPVSGSSRAAKPRQASSWSCRDTEPHCHFAELESSWQTLPGPARSSVWSARSGDWGWPALSSPPPGSGLPCHAPRGSHRPHERSRKDRERVPQVRPREAGAFAPTDCLCGKPRTWALVLRTQ